MPAKFTRKSYVRNGIYHIYNRGIEKRKIFADDRDYDVFLSHLTHALTPQLGRTIQTDNPLPTRAPKNFSAKISLLAYALMPTHFHLLIQQLADKSMNEFMQSLLTRYTMYYNQKYRRKGALFQGKYKAALIEEEHLILHASRFIHLKPADHVENLARAYTSYADYLGYRDTEWVRTDLILSYFDPAETRKPEILEGIATYRTFVEGTRTDSARELKELILEAR